MQLSKDIQKLQVSREHRVRWLIQGAQISPQDGTRQLWLRNVCSIHRHCRGIETMSQNHFSTFSFIPLFDVAGNCRTGQHKLTRSVERKSNSGASAAANSKQAWGDPGMVKRLSQDSTMYLVLRHLPLPRQLGRRCIRLHPALKTLRVTEKFTYHFPCHLRPQGESPPPPSSSETCPY